MEKRITTEKGAATTLAAAAPHAASRINDITLRHAKRMGFSDARIAQIVGRGAREADVRARRMAAGIMPVYKRVDTCAGEFESHTPYLYSTYETRVRGGAHRPHEGDDPRQRAQPHRPGHRVRLLLLPRRASRSRRRASRPSWSTATRRRCPPTTTPPTGCTSSRSRFEDVMNIVELEKPEGVVVQFGGQTPLQPGPAALHARA